MPNVVAATNSVGGVALCWLLRLGLADSLIPPLELIRWQTFLAATFKTSSSRPLLALHSNAVGVPVTFLKLK